MELRDYLRGLRRHWLAIVLMTALGVAVGFGWAKLQTPVYEATASGLVRSADSEDETALLMSDSMAMQKLPTYMQMAAWKEVAQGAVDELRIDISPQAAATLVTVENPDSTALIKVTARGSSPEDAAALAEAWISSLTATIDRVEGGSTGSAPMTIYLASLAAVPMVPIFPDMRTALVVGGLLGVGFGISFALIRTASDRRIRVADDVEDRAGLSLIGSIPIAPRGVVTRGRLFASTPNAPSMAVKEAFGSLRTNLRFVDVDNPPRKIVVTSALPGDGKSTVACNLAVALAASGVPVALVDGDLRRPTVADTMGIVGSAGLTDVLSGRADLVDVLQRVSDIPNLIVLGAGSTPPNPSEVLGSARMLTVLDQLAEHATVIIDAPPLLPTTDGAVLASQSDGAIIVASLGKTTYDLVEKAVDTLEKANSRALGLVLNKVPLRGVDASPYARVYGEAYVKTDVPADSAAPTLASTGSASARAKSGGRNSRAKSSSTALSELLQEFDATQAPPAARGERAHEA